jgi:nicotinate-nucleotide pyrophosphorylase (carboxylating)
MKTRKAVLFYWGSKLNRSSRNNEKEIRAYAECGVNYISSGALTFCL